MHKNYRSLGVFLRLCSFFLDIYFFILRQNKRINRQELSANQLLCFTLKFSSLHIRQRKKFIPRQRNQYERRRQGQGQADTHTHTQRQELVICSHYLDRRTMTFMTIRLSITYTNAPTSIMPAITRVSWCPNNNDPK